jgi:hypothetical protein
MLFRANIRLRPALLEFCAAACGAVAVTLDGGDICTGGGGDAKYEQGTLAANSVQVYNFTGTGSGSSSSPGAGTGVNVMVASRSAPGAGATCPLLVRSNTGSVPLNTTVWL